MENYGWLVVVFDTDKSIEAVPSNWYNTTTDKVYFPTTKDVKNIRNAIETAVEPSSTWPSYKVKILSRCDNFAQADRRAARGTNSDNVSSHGEEIGNTSGNTRVRKPPLRYASEAETSSESYQSDGGSSRAATPPLRVNDSVHSQRTKKTLLSAKGQKQTNSSYDLYDGNTIPHPQRRTLLDDRTNTQSVERYASMNTPTNFESSAGNLQRKTFRHETDTENQIFNLLRDLQRRVVRMELKIDQLQEGMDRQILLSANNVINEDVFKDIKEFLPLKTIQQLVDFEELLKLKFDSAAKLLGLEGGENVKHATRNVMRQLFSDEFSKGFSWKGAKGKKALNSYERTAQLIIESVRQNQKTSNATSSDIIAAAKYYLVKSTERLKKKEANVINNAEI
ncbi:uncharacterized protein LOC116161619 isoform X3 [Photinus pyralis]|uniref:uncharacterized protein LOC116161440 isoform X3 n=1 Tax=Photinus pyralis TaxID=7054 RepID=UPI0012673FBC|nr:uncharacterized protein LOC116161440 isoform X3 [Photinus pyralis]XP_031330644.1 uncharacterized protein LOC116161440 isoform X3 [Photinus pyralis]XP_031330889.1 uncharacterized protein LOC116161619 isoform X3 [Photinus pyralis]XP_031330890.1 uncharacterized protein LOC116161619 isoform X3 [Photinus pyralis]